MHLPRNFAGHRVRLRPAARPAPAKDICLAKKVIPVPKPRASYRRAAPDDRKRQLGEAALRCIEKNGAAGVSVRQIAAEAGVTQGLITHHFGEISELVAYAFEMVSDGIHQAITATVEAAGPTPQERMDAYIEALFSSLIFDRSTLGVWIVFWGMVLHSPRMSEVQQRDHAAYVSRLELLLGDLARDEGFGIADLHLAAVAFASVLDGLWLNWCLNPSLFKPEQGVTMLKRWIEGLRRGAYA